MASSIETGLRINQFLLDAPVGSVKNVTGVARSLGLKDVGRVYSVIQAIAKAKEWEILGEMRAMFAHHDIVVRSLENAIISPEAEAETLHLTREMPVTVVQPPPGINPRKEALVTLMMLTQPERERVIQLAKAYDEL